MNRIKRFIFATIIFLMAVAGLGIAAPARAESAVVVKDFSCSMLNASGGYLFSTDSHAVYSSDASGNSKITCIAGLPAGEEPEGSIKWNYANTGLLCGTVFGVTSDWQEVITPSGRANLTCHVNQSSAI